MLPEDQKRILGYFIEEAKDHLNTIEQGLLNLPATIQDAEMMNEVFRAAHSVKGGAAMLGINSMQRTAHRMEDFFKLMKESPVSPDRNLESMLLQIFDGLQEQLEQLQSPFGLTDDQAQTILTNLEPVFAQAETHLTGLLGAIPAAPAPVAAPTPVAAPAPTAATHAEASALHLVFRSDIPELLREMLSTFKQADNASSRQQLGQICQRLHSLGEQFEIPEWCQLAQTVGQAVGNLDQTYRTLAPIVIKDLKQAQDLVVVGQGSQVAPTEALLALVPVIPTPVEDDFVLDALLAEALEDNSDQDDLADLFASAEATATDAADLVDTDNWLDQITAAEADVVDEAGLEAVFGDLDGATTETATNFGTQHHPGIGPQVGSEELNSLADLFEGEHIGLDEIWEEEDFGEVGQPLNADGEPSEEDIDSEFADLFQTGVQPDGSATATDGFDDDMVSLFGHALDQSLTTETDTEPPHPTEPTPEDSIPLASPIAEAPAPTLPPTSEPQTSTSSPAPVATPVVMDVDDFFEVAPTPTSGTNRPTDVDDFFTDIAPPTAHRREPTRATPTATAQTPKTPTSTPQTPSQPVPPVATATVTTPGGGDVSPDGAAPLTDVLTDGLGDQPGAVQTEGSLPSSLPPIDELDTMPELNLDLDLGEVEATDNGGLFDLETPSLAVETADDDLNYLFDHLGDDTESTAEVTSSLTSTEAWSLDAAFDAVDSSPADLPAGAAEPDPGTVVDPFADLSLLDLDLPDLTPSPVASGAEAGEPSAPDAESEDDWLSDLDALVADQPGVASNGNGTGAPPQIEPLPEVTTSAGEDEDFSDLEALLDTEALPPPPPPAAAAPPMVAIPAPTPAAPTNDDDGFGDLEKLLGEADQLGGSSPSLGSRRGGASTNRRAVAPADQTMRVSVSHLDNLNNLVGELVVNRNSLEQDQERLRQFLDNLLNQVGQLNDVGQRMRDLYERSLLESSLMANRQAFALGSSSSSYGGSHATGATFDALEMDRFTGFHTLSQEMIELIVRVREASSDIEFTIDSTDQIARQFRQVTTQLQEGLNKARMVPFGQTAERLPRAVRDISLKCGKEAKLVVEGRDTLIDKMILERLYDPMTHLVNNAITHGIESPEERLATGKPREGTITVRAFYQGNQTVIYIADNGGGINPVVVKTKALQKGLITPAESQTMTDLEVYDLLFEPGFSTRDQADAFSGRGVGMDVVRTALADIRGSITIESEVGKGTSFTIRLPLTLSITKALSCVNNQARIAFPMDGVEDMFDVPKERIQTDDQGHTSILWRDTLLPFRPLGELLKFNRSLGRGRVYGGSLDEDVVSIVVLRSASTFIGLQVDQVIGEQEIVIKQLEGPVPKPTGIAGATVLGDGRVMPIADVLELIDMATGRVRREAPASLWMQPAIEEPVDAKAHTEPTVLIVDDSITVRELLSMSFNKVGYRVEQARDGQEAWEKLRSGLPCDLVFCDIEMPRMDGLELLSRIQKDEALNQIPIAMLTSRGADRHRQMAIDLGAKGYFTKPYLEEMLLDAAQRMLKGEMMITLKGDS